MPHASLKLRPGVDQNETPALNEAGISASELVRVIPDQQQGALVQKLGGWTKYFPNTTPAITRALWAWQDTLATKHLAYGTESKPPEAMPWRSWHRYDESGMLAWNS